MLTRLNRSRWATAALALLLATPAWAGQYEEAMAARDRGDFVNALRSFKDMASRGDANSQFQLSLMYASGKGVTADRQQALHWLRQAATHGNVQAQSNLGVAFHMGRVVPQDMLKAYAWLSLAASSGDRIATTNRDVVARKLSPAQMEQAKALAEICRSRNFAPCL